MTEIATPGPALQTDPTAGPVVARVSHLSHHYKKVAALDDVSLAIPAGIMAGFIGPDGVGKSSLLAVIAGARRIETGEVEVLGGGMRSRVHRQRGMPAHRLHAARPRQKSLSGLEHPRKHRVFRPPVRPIRRMSAITASRTF